MAKKTKKAAKKSATKSKAKTVAKKAKAVVKKAKAVVKKAAASVKKAPKVQAGLTRISPGFTANDAAATIKWFTDVLGFKINEKWEIEGEFRGGSVSSGNVMINIGQDDWKMGRDRVKGQGTRMYIETTQDIDKFAADIKARGGVLESEPADGWGVRAFSIADPDGFKYTFMSPRKR